MDIYDGDTEPMVFHGKTLTSKVSVREICTAIKRYAFVTSPYPVIISAEVHCGLAQQDMMAAMLVEIFGDMLVKAPVDGHQAPIEKLPSPEQLKGKVLLKAKNLFVVSEKEGVKEKEPGTGIDDSGSTTETSTDSDIVGEIKAEWKKVGPMTGLFLNLIFSNLFF